MWKLRGQFFTTVRHQRWDEKSSRWIVELSRSSVPSGHAQGDQPKPETYTVRAQFLFLAGGVMTTPQYPQLNGLDHFRSSTGKQVIHTARWDWTASGGSPSRPDLTRFQGKRVGIIGTGATSVQVLPHLAKWAGHTYVFQRTPAYVAPHAQQKTTLEDWEKIANEPSWQYTRMANLDACMTKEPVEDNLVGDGWTRVGCLSAFVGADHGIVRKDEAEAHTERLLKSDARWAEEMRDRIDKTVKDASTAEKLKPWYPGFCRRPTFHDSYLEAFNSSSVTLVDTDGKGVTEYSANGVVANGEDYNLDVLILATGYQVAYADSCPSSVVNAPLIGRNGRSLKDKWDAEDFGTVFGIATHGFPNLFFFSASGVGVSNNLNAVLSTVTLTTARIVREALSKAKVADSAVIEVTKAYEDEYTDQVEERSSWFSALPSCLPNGIFGTLGDTESSVEEQAKKDRALARKSTWGGGILGYQRLIERRSKRDGLDGFVITG